MLFEDMYLATLKDGRTPCLKSRLDVRIERRFAQELSGAADLKPNAPLLFRQQAEQKGAMETNEFRS